MKSRRRAAESSVMVSNHHLLFADLAARRKGVGPDESAVLPSYKHIVLDEAHHIESGASDLFSVAVSLPSLNRIFYRLYRKKGRHGSGLLQRLAEKKSALAEKFVGEIPPIIEKSRSQAEAMDRSGHEFLTQTAALGLSGEPGEREKKHLCEPMAALFSSLSRLATLIADTIEELDDDAPDVETKGLIVEVRQSAASLKEATDILDSFLNRMEFPDQVFWMDVLHGSADTQHLIFHRTPLSVADMVRESVWEPHKTVVGVSATLAAGGNFEHWKHCTGANDITPPPLEAIFPSPFDFASRVLLGIPSDSPDPENRKDWEAYLIKTTAAAVDLAGGHALVLFTSYETLKTTMNGVKKELGDSAPVLLKQGDDDRGRLLKKFRDTASSVLFATDSFWEGVDIPGESLRLVLITRLPFRPPNNPVAEARRQALAQEGGNPFIQLTVPEAVTRFRQGFGRLMRRRDDHGAVLVLDPRICRKRYGRFFLDSLPPVSKCIEPTQSVLRAMEAFLFP